MTLEEVQRYNAIEIHPVSSKKITRYGRILSNYHVQELIDCALKRTDIPLEGSVYIPSFPPFEELSIKKDFSSTVFGGLPIEIGYCNGVNRHMNGLEYHKSSEVFIAVSPCILFLGRFEEISEEGTYLSLQAEAYYFPEKSVFECYSGTLHFGPCSVEQSGYRSIIILPEGTNTPLHDDYRCSFDPESRLLFMKNKWLLAHPDRTPLIEKGAWPGILGKNLFISLD